MKNGVLTPKIIRQRKLMLVLPLLVLPFITLLFWALGGGRTDGAKTEKESGFNSRLPGANLAEDKSMDKMSYYDQAKLDSLKFQRLITHDPNYIKTTFSSGHEDSTWEDRTSHPEDNTGLNKNYHQSGHVKDPHTEKIYRKLAELDKELARPSLDSKTTDHPATYKEISQPIASVNTADVDRLEQMMQLMRGSTGLDPELQQLNGMLEKILDIQHPERVQAKLHQHTAVKKGETFSVQGKGIDSSVSLLGDPSKDVQPNRFYAIDETAMTAEAKNAIQAVIHETQTIVNGATVKLRLNEDMYINGILLPKEGMLVGTASLNNERLNIKINSIRHNNTLFPVELQVYDMDGLEGIHVPGAITRDVAKQTADRSLQAIGMASLEPSWGAQAANAGIEAAKSLLSKKVRQVKVTLKGGYRVLLQDQTERGRIPTMTY